MALCTYSLVWSSAFTWGLKPTPIVLRTAAIRIQQSSDFSLAKLESSWLASYWSSRTSTSTASAHNIRFINNTIRHCSGCGLPVRHHCGKVWASRSKHATQPIKYRPTSRPRTIKNIDIYWHSCLTAHRECTIMAGVLKKMVQLPTGSCAEWLNLSTICFQCGPLTSRLMRFYFDSTIKWKTKWYWYVLCLYIPYKYYWFLREGQPKFPDNSIGRTERTAKKNTISQ